MENEALVEQIQAGQNISENMATLYQQNQRFIYKMVKPYTSFEEMDDLLQEAYFILEEAVKTYDESQGKFITWLGNYIKWQLPRRLTDIGSIELPVGVFDAYMRYDRVKNAYISENGTDPSDQTIMQMMGIDARELRKIKRADKILHKGSLQMRLSDNEGNEGSTLIEMIPDESDPYTVVDDEIDNAIFSVVLKEAMQTLTEKQRSIVTLYCMLGLPYKEVMNRLNIRNRQSMFQNRDHALKKIRACLIAQDQLQSLYEDAYCGVYRGSYSNYMSTQTSTPEKIALRNLDKGTA